MWPCLRHASGVQELESIRNRMQRYIILFVSRYLVHRGQRSIGRIEKWMAILACRDVFIHPANNWIMPPINLPRDLILSRGLHHSLLTIYHSSLICAPRDIRITIREIIYYEVLRSQMRTMRS